MKRLRVEPRPSWQSMVEKQGLTWHSEQGLLSWDERAAYILTKSEVASLLRAAREILELIQRSCAYVVQNNLWEMIGLQDEAARIVAASWCKQEFSLCGRFDFLFNEQGKPKLLEFNAETALSLVETAVIQKDWLASVMPEKSQCNDLETQLIQRWRSHGPESVHCVWRPRHTEVEGTVRYMAKLLRGAGIQCSLMAMHRVGWDSKNHDFVNEEGVPITTCYKIYPWDWMVNEPFAAHVLEAKCKFVEPAWRLMAGSKGILCVLSKLFSDHPAVLPCSRTRSDFTGDYVSKPLFGHEGQNVTIHSGGKVLETLAGECGEQELVFQQMVTSSRVDGRLAQFGVWVVGNEPVAIGMRESEALIISGKSPFVPHAID